MLTHPIASERVRVEHLNLLYERMCARVEAVGGRNPHAVGRINPEFGKRDEM